MENLTVVVPFYNGHNTIERLINSIPVEIPIILVDDVSEQMLFPPQLPRNIKTMRSEHKGYFTGAVNRGIQACNTDVLVLNQDAWFEDDQAFALLESHRSHFGLIGERIRGTHPAFGELGYIHGTFMFISRDTITTVGLLNSQNYPLWGSTAEYQWRVARKNIGVLPLKEIPGFRHERPATERFGSSIKTLLQKEPHKHDLLVRTPPLVSVIVPCYNYGRYLDDCVNSLIGGPTVLGDMPGQTLQSFEIIIVDDASTDDSMEFIRRIASPAKGIRAFRLEKNSGTAQALNFGIQQAVGKYITFLSADDMREPGSLEKLVATCEENPHSFAYDDIWLFNKHQRMKKWQMPEYDFETLLWKNHVHAGILFPRQAWVETGGYPAVMGDGREDWAFNIALGIKGWCGVHVHEYGYLYRREGQNRTERNTTESHRERFLAKIMDLFPDIYRGLRPMACCGKGSNTRKNVGVTSTFTTRSVGTVQNSMIGAQGMVKLEYLGNQMSFTISGDTTNAKYTFGVDRKLGWVDQRDVGTRDSRSGFLSKRHNGKYLFKLADSEETVEQLAVPEGSEVTGDQSSVQPDENGSSDSSGTLSVVENDTEAATDATEGNDTPALSAQSTGAIYNVNDMTVDELKALEGQNLSREQWLELYKAEMAGRNRKGAVAYMEELLANWQE